MHSTNSDGKDHPHEVFRDYEGKGFDFAVLTDHQAVVRSEDLDHGGSLVAIPGCEYRGSGTLPEMGLGGVRQLPPIPVDLEASARAAQESGAFVVYNHPNWHFDHWPSKAMLRLKAAHAMEIYNAVVEELQGSAESTNKWDALLSYGYRIWGAAGDDAHESAHRNQAWVQVMAERDEASIIEALKAGKFYASTGIEVKAISIQDGVWTVDAPDAHLIRFIVERGQVRSQVRGSQASYKIQEKDVYVRVEIYGTGMQRAWLNPVFVENDHSRAFHQEFSAWYEKQPFS